MAQQGSPLLDQYNQDGIVTPALQRALDAVRQKLPQFQGLQSSAPDTATRTLQPPGVGTVPPITRTPAAPSPGLVAPGGQAPPQSPPNLGGVPSTPMITDPEAGAHLSERDRLINTGSGISQVQNPVKRGLLRAADIAGSAFFPNITAQIPGTELHHRGLVQRSEGYVDKDVARAKENANTEETQARVPLTEAQTRETNAKADAAAHPKDQLEWAESAEPAVDPEHPELGPQHFFYNKADPSQKKFGGTMAAKPTDKPEVIHEFTDKDGKVWQIHADGTASAITANGKPLEGKTTKEPLEDRIVNEYMSSHPGVSLAEARRATAVKEPTADIGTWSLQEDKEGKPVLFNSKTSETKPVEGVQRAGTAAKDAAAKEKELGPATAAIGYARDYLKNGAFTGAGDEALQEKFFELAKPATGFRMSQPQMDMLQNSRGWMESVTARVRHASKGTWFSDEQRKQIVDTMEQLAKVKLGGSGGEQGTIRARDPQGKLHEAPAGTALPAGWKQEK